MRRNQNSFTSLCSPPCLKLSPKQWLLLLLQRVKWNATGNLVITPFLTQNTFSPIISKRSGVWKSISPNIRTGTAQRMGVQFCRVWMLNHTLYSNPLTSGWELLCSQSVSNTIQILFFQEIYFSLCMYVCLLLTAASNPPPLHYIHHVLENQMPVAH